MVSALDFERWGREFEVSHVLSVVSLGRILCSSVVFLRSGVRERKVLNCTRENLTYVILIASTSVMLSTKMPTLVA